MTSVKVAVRVRPLNSREDGLDSQVIIQMEGDKTKIINPKSSEHGGEGDSARDHFKVREFTFDHSFWSVNEKDGHYATQTQVFSSLGEDVVNSAFDGYNVCIFAYGQTGSGKTYTMMGSKEDPGLIPRYCNTLFSRLTDNSASYQVHVSYLEIYNEKVRDLLSSVSTNPNKPSHNLRVREHPRDGPYVQDLSKHVVVHYDALAELMVKGNMNRTTASTNMNDVSSRSHAIFTITFTQARFMDGLPSERQSKINLVDLAGSERADATGATGQRLKEGGSINKSLVSLGNVISLLAERSENGNKGRNAYIPYRDSVLTWLLKDSLGGNAKTIMIATISPADVNYGETLSTLRYANRAKNIINRPTVNEDPNVRLIRELREEIARLKSLLDGAPDISPRDQEKLHEKEARIKVLTEEWAEKWKESANLLQDKNLALRQEGLGVILDSTLPHLIGIDDDVLSTGIKLYHLKEGITKIGSEESEEQQDIIIAGPEVTTEHCVIEHQDGSVFLHPIEGALCAVNGHAIGEPTKLTQGMLITLGKTNMFRFNHPEQVKELKKMQTNVRKSASTISLHQGGEAAPKLSLLSQSMSDLYRSNESLALNGSLLSLYLERWDISSTTYREDQEELEQKRMEIMELEDTYTSREEQRREMERQVQEELAEKNDRLMQLEEEIDTIKSKNNPYDNIVEGLRQLDRQEEELLEDLRISKENLLKEVENLTWYPDQVREEEVIASVVADLNKQISDMERQIDDFKDAAQMQKEALSGEEKEVLEKQRLLARELSSLEADYEAEKRQLLSNNENVLHEVQDLALREEDILSQHRDTDALKKAQWQEGLSRLKEHNITIEEAWGDLEENEAVVKARLQNGGFSSAQEKLSCEQEAQQLSEARRLLGEEEKTFAAHQQAEMLRVEREMEAWEEQKAAELGSISSSRRNVLWRHSEKLQRLDGQMEHTRDTAQEVKAELEQVQNRMCKVNADTEKEVASLQQEHEARVEERRSVERKSEQKEQQRRDKIEELESEIDSLEHMYQVRLDDIQTERMRLVGLQEEVLRKSSLDAGSGPPLDLHMAHDLKTQRLELETRQKELETFKTELESAKSELESRQRKFDEEREAQLDKLEFEKLKLLDMERQDRVNSLVEQEVKCRLFEEKLERERLRKAEREREKQERDREIQKLKSMHQREMNQLKAKLEDGALGKNRSLVRSQSCTTDAMPTESFRRNLVKQLTLAEPQAPLNIEVPTFVLRGSGRDLHYEYLVKVSVGSESWCIFRRYSRFREMHTTLKKKYPVVNQLVFPPRRFFHKNKKVAAERRQLLEEYVRHAVELCMRITECPLHPSQNRQITKQALVDFEPFFRRGLFETARNLTS
ncbi:kinesin-like protein KIF16B [Aplysia californica]|uniref:Kinesin-like protein KIF16B n=1 Tax=Aplysia californica TaxID=6500 RepID=A0ABM0ZXX5_APLCA|nr:kinesin-like protein KIF16B [Aplysia californica]